MKIQSQLNTTGLFKTGMHPVRENASPQSAEFDLFLILDNDDDISSEEISDTTHPSSPPGIDLESCVFDTADTENMSLLDYFDEEDAMISDSEYNSMKPEDLWGNDWLSQSTDPSCMEQSNASTQPDHILTTQPPEFDQLHNLPLEIVERPRYFSQKAT